MDMDAVYKEQKHEAKRNEILDGLLRLLHEKSGTPISVSELARSLGIAKGGLYHYFPTIDHAFARLVEREYGKAIDAVRATLATMESETPLDKIATIATTYIQALPHSSALDRLLHQDAYAHIHQQSMVFITRELGEVVRTVIAEGTADNSLTCPDPHATAFVVVGALAFLGDAHLFSAPTDRRKALIRETLRLSELALGIPAGSLTS